MQIFDRAAVVLYLPAFCLVCFIFLTKSGMADETAENSPLKLRLPFAFYNETFGISGGWVEGRVGSPQPQARILGTIIAGDEGSALGFIAAEDLRLPEVDRLFIDPIFSFGYYDDADTYVDGNPNFSDERAGTNDSDKDNFVTGGGTDVFSRIRFKYLLPIGHGRNQIIPDYKTRDGFLVSGATGGDSLNPFNSGRSFTLPPLPPPPPPPHFWIWRVTLSLLMQG